MCTSSTEDDMSIDQIIAAAHAKRLTAGLVISFDNEDGTVRCTKACASVDEREKAIARLTIRGRNPRVEVA